MANSNEEEEKKETKQLRQNSKSSPVKKPKEHNEFSCLKYSSLFSSATFIIAIAAIIITLYTNQTNKKIQKHLIDENKSLMTQVGDVVQNQSSIQDQLDAKANKMQRTQRHLQNKIDNLNKELQRAMNQRLYQNKDWLLLKARYYIELAQINAHWSDTNNATIELLQQADKLLNQLNAPKIFEIRQAIAKEIAQLKALPTVDKAGLLSQLDAAQLSVNNLTIQSAIIENKPIDQIKTTQTSNTSTWRSHFNDSVELLEKLIIVRRTDENIKPLISPLFESILRESIRLNLQEAQWAILNDNPIVYQLALKQASINLKRTFNETAQNTIALLKQISELQQIKLNQEKPVVGLALPILNQMIDNKELLDNQIHNNEKGEN